MDVNLILAGRTAKVLLGFLVANSEQAQELKAYFSPYCDCDVTQWIVSRVEAQDSFVIGKIRDIIQARDEYPLLRGNYKPVNGQLLSQYCSGRNFYGIYANGLGGTNDKLIDDSGVQCGGALKARFYFPLEPQRAALMADQPVTFSAFHIGEPNDVDTEPYITSYKLYDPISVSGVRFKIKVGGLLEDEYQGLTVKMIGSRDADGNFYDIPDINNTYPYNSNPGSETVNLSYDETQRIITVYIPYIWERWLDAYLCVIKNNRIIGWLVTTTNLFWKNQGGTIRDYKTWIINPGSDNFG
jgi:hypothetical protein